MGNDFFDKVQRGGRVSFAGTSHEEALPYIHPRALLLLSNLGLVNRTGHHVSRRNSFRGILDESMYNYE